LKNKIKREKEFYFYLERITTGGTEGLRLRRANIGGFEVRNEGGEAVRKEAGKGLKKV
jgi:hypothetical protein